MSTPKIAVVVSTAGNYNTLTSNYICNAIQRMGCAFDIVSIGSNGRLLKVGSSSVEMTADEEATYVGCIYWAGVVTGSGFRTFMSITHPWKPLIIGYGSLANTATAPALTTGMSASINLSGTEPSFLGYTSSSHELSTSVATDQNSVVVNGSFWLHTHDGTTPIRHLGYTFDAAGNRRYWLWATAQAMYWAWQDNYHMLYYIVPIYLSFLGVTAPRPINIYLTADDVNFIAESNCISAMAAVLREQGAVMPCGWGTSSTNLASMDGCYKASTLPDLVASADVMPVMLHDHKTFVLGTHTLTTIEDVLTAWDAAKASASAAAGFDLLDHYCGVILPAGSAVTTVTMRALYERGMRVVRYPDLRDGGVSNILCAKGRGHYKLYSDSSERIRFIGLLLPSGGYDMTVGSRMDGAFSVSTEHTIYTRATIAALMKYSVESLRAHGEVVLMFHGPQFSKSRTGSIQIRSTMVADDSISIGDQTYTFKASPSGDYEVAIGANAGECGDNLYAKIAANTAITDIASVSKDAGASGSYRAIHITPTSSNTSIIITGNNAVRDNQRAEMISAITHNVAVNILEHTFLGLARLAPDNIRLAGESEWKALR